MSFCVANGCSNRTSRKSVNQKQKPKVSFHLFPKDERRRTLWVQACREEPWTPSVRSVLCSEHFNSECFDRTSQNLIRLKPNAVPTLFSTISQCLEKSQRIIEKSSNNEKIDIKVQIKEEPQDSETYSLGFKQPETKDENSCSSINDILEIEVKQEEEEVNINLMKEEVTVQELNVSSNDPKSKGSLAQNNGHFTAKECRIVMKYLFLKGYSAKQIYDDMIFTLGDKGPSYPIVKNWVTAFRTGHLGIEDEHCLRGPTQRII